MFSKTIGSASASITTSTPVSVPTQGTDSLQRSGTNQLERENLRVVWNPQNGS